MCSYETLRGFVPRWECVFNGVVTVRIDGVNLGAVPISSIATITMHITGYTGGHQIIDDNSLRKKMVIYFIGTCIAQYFGFKLTYF